MHCFMAEIKIPLESHIEREILHIEEKGEHLLHWTNKELDQFYSGEKWKRVGNIGIIAVQYLSHEKARILVSAATVEVARKIIESYSWGLNSNKRIPKTFISSTFLKAYIPKKDEKADQKP